MRPDTPPCYRQRMCWRIVRTRQLEQRPGSAASGRALRRWQDLVPDHVVQNRLGGQEEPPVEARNRALRASSSPSRVRWLRIVNAVYAVGSLGARLHPGRRGDSARRAPVPAARARQGRARSPDGTSSSIAAAVNARPAAGFYSSQTSQHLAEVRHAITPRLCGDRLARVRIELPARRRSIQGRSSLWIAAAASRSGARRGSTTSTPLVTSTVTLTRRARVERRMLYAMWSACTLRQSTVPTRHATDPSADRAANRREREPAPVGRARHPGDPHRLSGRPTAARVYFGEQPAAKRPVDAGAPRGARRRPSELPVVASQPDDCREPGSRDGILSRAESTIRDVDWDNDRCSG